MQVFGLRVKAALGITLLAVAAMTGCSGMSTPGTSAGPSLSFTQSSVTFGSVAVGKTKTFTETITNSSAAMSQASVIGAAIATNNITILQISSSSSSYSVTGISLPATLAPGQSATFTVKFTPKSTGTQAGTLSVSTDATEPMTLNLMGTGATPSTIAASHSSLSFGSVQTGTTGVIQEVLSNSGSSTMNISSIVASGTGFALNGVSAPIVLEPGQTVAFNARFSPTTTGSQTGSFKVNSDASNSPLTISATGTGVADGGLTVSPASVNFGSVQVGVTQTVTETLTNSGGSSLTISAANVTGAQFSISGLTLPATLSAGQSASFSVRFKPTATGSASGSIAVASDGSNPNLSIALAGSGVADGALSATPSTINFGTVVVGGNQTVTETLTNSGGSNLKITAAAASGAGFSLSGLALPTTLGPGQTASFSVKFAAGATGNATGDLTITSDGSNPTLTIPLSGNGVADGALTASPSSVNFGSVVVGNNQTTTETLTNSGGTSLKITAASASGSGFSMSGLALPVTLSVGQSVSFSVKFAPTVTGSAAGNVTITSDGSNPTLAIPLSGDGAADGSLTANPSSVNFGSVVVGNNQTTAETLTNSGGSSLKITAASASGSGFSMSGLALPVTLNAGQSVSFSVKFAPTATGSATGNVTITSDGSNPTLNIPLSGNGTADGAVAATPSTLSFGSVQVGNNQSLTQTLTNSGGSSLKITAASASGTGFSMSGLALPVTLNAGQSVSFSVKFAPTTGGNATGGVTITSDGSNPTLNIPLSGTGVTPGTAAASPTSLSFGSIQVGNSSTKSETLTNNGGSSITVTGASSTSAAFSVSGLSLPTTLTAGQSVTFSVVFSPSASGSASGNLTLTSNASNPSLTVALSGTGTAPGQLAASPASQSFGSVVVGSSTSKTGTLSATGSSVQVTGVTSDNPEFKVSGITFPATIAAGGSASFTVTFTPAASGASSGVITFASNASNTASQSLSGSGTAPAPHSVDLSWTASTGSGIVGYNVYRGTKTGGPYTKVNSSLNVDTTFTDTTVAAGNTYFYVVTAVDGSGTESSYSNEAKAVVPSP